jgi:opacity protein-like surface antigen
MKKMLGLVALLTLSSLPTLAQDTPKLEFGGGYAFRSWQVPPLAQPPSRFNMNGWDANATYNFTNKISAALDVTDTRNNSNGDQSIYSFMAGPRLYPVGHHKLTPFVHVMAGLGRYKLYLPPDPTIPEPALNYSENRLAFDFGGGIDASINSRVAIRVAQVDYERTVFTVFTDPGSQNNYRFSAGVVVHLGSK